jgi:hypothetical protein
MDFIISVKDEYIQGLGTFFGNPDKPVEAIQAKLQSEVDRPLPEIIKNYDPEVLALTAARDQKLQEKLAATKETEIKGK